MIHKITAMIHNITAMIHNNHHDLQYNCYDPQYNCHDLQYNRYDLQYTHHDLQYNHHDPQYNHHDPEYNRHDPVTFSDFHSVGVSWPTPIFAKPSNAHRLRVSAKLLQTRWTQSLLLYGVDINEVILTLLWISFLHFKWQSPPLHKWQWLRWSSDFTEEFQRLEIHWKVSEAGFWLKTFRGSSFTEETFRGTSFTEDWRVSEARGCLWGDASQPASQPTRRREEPSTQFLSKFHCEVERIWRPLWRLSPHHSFNESQRPALQIHSSTLDTGNFSAAAKTLPRKI